MAKKKDRGLDYSIEWRCVHGLFTVVEHGVRAGETITVRCPAHVVTKERDGGVHHELVADTAPGPIVKVDGPVVYAATVAALPGQGD